jgi:hypothetical protein
MASPFPNQKMALVYPLVEIFTINLNVNYSKQKSNIKFASPHQLTAPLG